MSSLSLAQEKTRATFSEHVNQLVLALDDYITD